MRYRLRTLLIVLAIGPAVMWTAYRKLFHPKPVGTVETPAEFNALTSSGSVVVFVDVDWSLEAQQAGVVVASLRRRLASDFTCSAILFRRVDFTNNDTHLYRTIKEWLLSQNANWVGLRGGYGSLIWIKDGEVKDSLVHAGDESAEKLFARTLIAFKEE